MSEGCEVYAINFLYGLDGIAKNICIEMDIDYGILDDSFLKRLLHNTLNDNTIKNNYTKI